jgi:hypothetical protein
MCRCSAAPATGSTRPREAIKKFKFERAIKGGEAASTTITYNYTFLLG